MNHFEFDPDLRLMQLRSWAAEVAKESTKKCLDSEDQESYPIITRKRSEEDDLFFRTHQLKRRG